MKVDDGVVVERAASPPELSISEEETVLLDIDGGHYFTLTGTVSVRIWQMLAVPRSTGALVDRLVEEFDVERDRCREETGQFLDELIAKRLIRLVE